MFLWAPVWMAAGIGVVAAVLLIGFLVHIGIRLTIDAVIASIRDNPARLARRERAYIAKHQRENSD